MLARRHGASHPLLRKRLYPTPPRGDRRRWGPTALAAERARWLDERRTEDQHVRTITTCLRASSRTRRDGNAARRVRRGRCHRSGPPRPVLHPHDVERGLRREGDIDDGARVASAPRRGQRRVRVTVGSAAPRPVPATECRAAAAAVGLHPRRRVDGRRQAQRVRGRSRPPVGGRGIRRREHQLPAVGRGGVPRTAARRESGDPLAAGERCGVRHRSRPHRCGR